MTGSVRPLERADLPGARCLLERHARAGGACPPSPVEDHLARTLLDHPWADPELPSLVYVESDGRISGLVASFARRMVRDGRPIRVRVLGGFVVDDRVRGRGVGSRLLAECFAGPQDVTMTDGSNDVGRQRWTAAGGRTLLHASVGWRRVLRPGAAAAGSAWSARRPDPVRRAVAALARPADAAVASVPPLRRRVRPPRPATVGEPLTPAALARSVAAGGRRLRPDYDAGYLTWLFDELEPAGLVRTLVRGPGGAELGWYVCATADPLRVRVLQIGGSSAQGVGAALDHLLADADARGAAVVEGRLEPDLAEPLRTRRASLFPTTWTLVHADDATLGLLSTSDGMLSRLDGEWWIGFLLWTPPGVGARSPSGAARPRAGSRR